MVAVRYQIKVVDMIIQSFVVVARRIAYLLSIPVVILLMPLKKWAYLSRFEWLRRTILAFTTPIDFLLIWLNVQNPTMLLHWRLYRGNFIFGKTVMVVDYETAAAAIVQPLMKNSNFMGVNIVSSNPDAFATNAPILTQCPPIRAMTRKYIDEHIFTTAVRCLSPDAIRAVCQEILDEWKQDPKMASTVSIRSTVIQVFFQLLSQKRIPKIDADKITFQYMRRFVEFSLFSGYGSGILSLLGSRKQVRKDVYYKLKDYGIDLMTIDMTLFAALFSVGTLVLRCIEDLRRFGIVYERLSPLEKRHFVIEAQRLYPTVTTVHRVVEKDETVTIGRSRVRLSAGDEVAYPFTCIHRDASKFPNPEAMDLNRSPAEYESVLSWSKGPHECPAKELSIIIAIMLLDTLAKRYSLSNLHLFNPEF